MIVMNGFIKKLFLITIGALAIGTLVVFFASWEQEEDQINKKVFTCGQVFTDKRDGNEYPTLWATNRCWFAQNLRFSEVAHKTDFPTTIISEDPYTTKTLKNNITDSFCLNDDCSTGHLYLDDEAFLRHGRSICPEPFRIPTEQEIRDLEQEIKIPIWTDDIYQIWTWLDGDDQWFGDRSASVYMPGTKHIDHRLGWPNRPYTYYNRSYVKCVSD